jgi:hypothetical protein
MSKISATAAAKTTATAAASARDAFGLKPTQGESAPQPRA